MNLPKIPSSVIRTIPWKSWGQRIMGLFIRWYYLFGFSTSQFNTWEGGIFVDRAENGEAGDSVENIILFRRKQEFFWLFHIFSEVEHLCLDLAFIQVLYSSYKWKVNRRICELLTEISGIIFRNGIKLKRIFKLIFGAAEQLSRLG